MSAKPRRKRGKQAPIRKARVRQHAEAAARASAGGRIAPTALPSQPPPPAAQQRPQAAPQPARHPHIGAELRTIGILAGVMAGILVVLRLTLS